MHSYTTCYQKLSGLHQSSHSFSESEKLERLHQCFWLRVYHKVPSRCLRGLWSQLTVHLGENPLLSSFTWQRTGLRRPRLILLTVGRLTALAGCWPKIIVAVHLSLSLGLLTILLQVSSDTGKREQDRIQDGS